MPCLLPEILFREKIVTVVGGVDDVDNLDNT
jgi:hypothetical protein